MSYARYPSLEQAVVFITGGASGIGADMVRAFAEQGARVGFVDLAAREGRALADELCAPARSWGPKMGHRIIPMTSDYRVLVSTNRSRRSRRSSWSSMPDRGSG